MAKIFCATSNEREKIKLLVPKYGIVPRARRHGPLRQTGEAEMTFYSTRSMLLV